MMTNPPPPYLEGGGGMSKHGCRLPHENETAAQNRRKNGECKTYQLREPKTLEQLRELPQDLKADYLRWVLATYDPSMAELSRMLGVKPGTVDRLLDRLAIPVDFHRGDKGLDHKRQWAEFTGTEPPTPRKRAGRARKVKITEPKVTAGMEVTDNERAVSPDGSAAITYLQVTFSGLPTAEQIEQIKGLAGAGAEITATITVSKVIKGEK